MEDCHPYFTQSGSDRELMGDQHIARLSDGAWELNNLCTHPDFRHHGIGGKLLQHAEHTAKRFGGKGETA